MIKNELMNVIDTVAREKNIDYDEVVFAIENAIEKAAWAKYGRENDIRATIDRKTGEISLALCHTVVEEVVDPNSEITLEEGKARDPEAKIGDVLSEPLPPIDFGRVAAQTAKNVIYSKVREAERAHQYEEFKEKIGTIVSGVVKRVEYNNLILELGNKAEALLRRDEMIPREAFRPGDRVRAYLLDVRQEIKGPQLFLSRTHPQFLAKLFEQEVPEIYDGIIEIKSVARDPGSRAKMGVYATDSSIDPVGSCVGVRGSRVQAVVDELQGEKIDIIRWSPDVATFVVNALAPADVKKVVLDEENNRVDVVVPDDQLNIAIGRRGQNVKLASIVANLNIDVVTVSQDEERKTNEVKRVSQLFIDGLDVDEVIAHLLLSEGYDSIEQISLATNEDLLKIEGFDEDIISELKNRATEFLAKKEKEFADIFKAKKADKKLLDFLSGYPQEMIVMLLNEDITTLEDLAELAGDELTDVWGEEPHTITLNDANDLILKARKQAGWFDTEE